MPSLDSQKNCRWFWHQEPTLARQLVPNSVANKSGSREEAKSFEGENWAHPQIAQPAAAAANQMLGCWLAQEVQAQGTGRRRASASRCTICNLQRMTRSRRRRHRMAMATSDHHYIYLILVRLAILPRLDLTSTAINNERFDL